MLMTIIIFIIVLSILVLAHELGHFLTARSCGVKSEEFGLGFPPRIIGVYKNAAGKRRWVFGNRPAESLGEDQNPDVRTAAGATVYSLNWLPLGGFVKIKGENGEGKDDKDSFIGKKIWQRAVILAAGVVMNVVLAWVLFSAGYIIGMPQSTAELGKRAIVTESSVMVAGVLPDSPAAIAGLKEGDAILRINNEAVGSEKSLQDAVAKNNGVVTNLSVKRGDEEIAIFVTPASKDGGRATIGVSIFAAGLVRYPFFPALTEGAKTTGYLAKEICAAFIGLFGDIFAGHNVGDQLSGPVGIANLTGQTARLGFSYLLQFIALLSLNLAVINILPLPALDGGRILFLALEKIKGRPVKREVEAVIHNIGFFLLIALILFITYRDIIKLF